MRAVLVIPPLFALTFEGFGNLQMALFAAFDCITPDATDAPAPRTPITAAARPITQPPSGEVGR